MKKFLEIGVLGKICLTCAQEFAILEYRTTARLDLPLSRAHLRKARAEPPDRPFPAAACCCSRAGLPRAQPPVAALPVVELGPARRLAGGTPAGGLGGVEPQSFESRQVDRAGGWTGRAIWPATILDMYTRLRVARGIAKTETEALIEVFRTLKRRGHPDAPPPTIIARTSSLASLYQKD